MKQLYNDIRCTLNCSYIYSFKKVYFKKEKKILFSINNAPKRDEETPRAIKIKLEERKKKYIEHLN